MNKFGFLKLRTAPVWATILAGSAIFAGGAAYQWGGSCATCSDPQPVCCTPQYAPRQVTAYKTVYETVYDNVQKTEYVPTWTTEMRTRTCTVSKPITETAMREERYTVRVPYTETSYKVETTQQVRYVEENSEREEVQTVCRPVTKTGQRERVYTVQRPVTKTVMVNQTRMVPVEETSMVTTCEDRGCYVEKMELKERQPLFPVRLEWQSAKEITDCATGETARKPGGLYWVPRDVNKKGTYEVKKVWVPNQVTIQKPVTRTVMKQVCEQVPQTETVMVPQTVREMVPYTYTEMVQEQVVRKVPQKVLKPVCETVEKRIPVCETKYREEIRTRQVPYTVCKTIQEEKVEQYPVRVCKMVPVTKTVCVPRVVTRTVPYTYCEYAPAASGCTVGAPVPASNNSNPTPASYDPIPAPYTPSPSPSASTDAIPPAQYSAPAETSNPSEASVSDANKSDKSILVNDNAQPTTYSQPSAESVYPTTTADESANNTADAKFEQVYSANSAQEAQDAKAEQKALPGQPAAAETTTPASEQPRELSAPAEQPTTSIPEAKADSGTIKVDANVNADIPADLDPNAAPSIPLSSDLDPNSIPSLPDDNLPIPGPEPEY